MKNGLLYLILHFQFRVHCYFTHTIRPYLAEKVRIVTLCIANVAEASSHGAKGFMIGWICLSIILWLISTAFRFTSLYNSAISTFVNFDFSCLYLANFPCHSLHTAHWVISEWECREESRLRRNRRILLVRPPDSSCWSWTARSVVFGRMRFAAT